MSLERKVKKLFGDESVLKDREDLIDAARLHQVSNVRLHLGIGVANKGSMAECSYYIASYAGKFNGLPFDINTYRHVMEEGEVTSNDSPHIATMYRAELPAVAVLRNTGHLAGISFNSSFGSTISTFEVTDDGKSLVYKGAAGKEFIVPYRPISGAGK